MIAKKLGITLIFVLLISTVFTGCLGNLENLPDVTDDKTNEPTHTPGTDPEQKYVVYKDTSFKITFPETWSVEDKSDYSVNVVFKAPELGGNPSSFLPTVNVFVGDSEGIDDFNQYIDDVIENLKMHYVDFSLDNKEVNDDNSAILVYNGSLGGYNVKCKQLIGVKGDKLYIATYVSEKKSFDEYLEVADKIMNSLEI